MFNAQLEQNADKSSKRVSLCVSTLKQSHTVLAEFYNDPDKADLLNKHLESVTHP